MRHDHRTHVALAIAGALLFSGSALADRVIPAERSQHPRTGLLADLTFAVNSDQLRWGANRKLGRVAGWAAKHPYGAVVIEGHADHVGPDSYNVQLSLRRALAVRRELVQAGVDPAQIVIAAFGESADIRRGSNRRVAIWVTRSGRDVAMASVAARDPAVVRTGEDTAVRTATR